MNKYLQVLLFAAAVALPCFIIPHDSYFFECTIKSDQHAALVFYANLGRGFNDDDQSTTTLKAQERASMHRFALPSGKLKGLRLDFIDVASRVTIERLRIVSAGGAVVQSFPLDQLQSKDQVTLSPQSDTMELVPAAGGTTSSIYMHFEKPLRLPTAYNFSRRLFISAPWFLGAFALGWLLLLRIAGQKSSSHFAGSSGTQPASIATPSHPSNAFGHWVPWATLAAAALILFARMPDRFLQPQFYAEDGYFYACAIEHGAKAFLMPYGGYLLTADRLIAAVGVRLQALYAPAFFNGAALLVLLVVLSRVFSARITLPGKPLLVLMVVLLPRPQDIFLTITNIQWVLALALVLLLLSKDASRPRQYIYDCLAALAIGLTGVFSALLLPFFVWRAFQRRTKASLALTVIVGLTALVQVWLVVQAPPAKLEPIPGSLLTIPSIIGLRMFCLTFGGPWLVHPWKFVLPYFAILVAGWAVFLCRPAKGQSAEAHPRWLFLAIIGVFAAAALYRYKDMLPLYLKVGYSRYFYMSQLLFVWLIVFELYSHFYRRAVAAIALYAFLVTTLCTFRLEPLVDYRWSEYAPLVDQGKDVWMPINPAGWHCHISEVKK
ncbi:MAG: hypothetical protein QM715_17230 [Nibricoccus sp.]